MEFGLYSNFFVFNSQMKITLENDCFNIILKDYNVTFISKSSN